MNQTVRPNVTITTLDLECLGVNTATLGVGNLASAVYPTANTAIFIPFTLSTPFLVTDLLSVNGGVVSGNVDMGLYDEAGTKLVSIGSTAQAGANVPQLFDITNTELGANILYYLAVALDNITGTFFRLNTTTAGFARTTGMAEMASAFPLPATATLAAITAAYIPLIGLSGRGSI